MIFGEVFWVIGISVIFMFVMFFIIMLFRFLIGLLFVLVMLMVVYGYFDVFILVRKFCVLKLNLWLLGMVRLKGMIFVRLIMFWFLLRLDSSEGESMLLLKI